jgi:GNAT superfamily N-acetyltransferase
MRVVTTSLQQLTRPADAPRALPDGCRLDLATGMTPEFARFLYALVGGPWHWTDRLGWSREQWAEELAVPGSEFRVLVRDGVPAGYVQLHAEVVDGGTHVEIRYFGLAESAIGLGLGGPLLEQGIAAAWTLAERHPLPPTSRVWVHTCSLDGPAALANYRARGLVPYAEEETDEPVADAPLGSWVSTGGPTA